MIISDFTHIHAEEAVALSIASYEEARDKIPVLPKTAVFPDLTSFADNGLGVAAFENGMMIGFLCCYKPFDNAFGSTRVKGVFSPMGGNAAIAGNRAKIYAAMYQAAGDKWVRVGAVSHAVSLYAYDREALEQFFRYGFGLRCIDAIRPMELIDCAQCGEYEFSELPQTEYMSVYPLHTMLNLHQRTSPYFMNRGPDTPESFKNSYIKRKSRFFAAKYNGELCAYLKILSTGETFITNHEKYRHIGGAFCLPEHRGRGVYQNLLNFSIAVLKNEAFAFLGVDFESINPTGYGFWTKYFTAYTYGLARRIDEKIEEAL